MECKPVSTPVDVSSRLTCATDDVDCIEKQRYQSAIGSLVYLSVTWYRKKLTNEHYTFIYKCMAEDDKLSAAKVHEARNGSAGTTGSSGISES